MSQISNSVKNLPGETEFRLIQSHLTRAMGFQGDQPKSFRVSNNGKDVSRETRGRGFALKFVEHGCYSITPGFSNWKGYKSRMRQLQQINVGDILYLSESSKNNRVYQGVVLTTFNTRSRENPSLFDREDVREIIMGGRWAGKAHCDYETFQDWLEESNEHICKVQWSEAKEIDKTALNSGWIACTITRPLRSEVVHNLENQFR